jgi:heme-degrading monooxygenase HmoA
MILRVFEGRLKAGTEQEFMVGERELLTRTDIDGLLALSIGRRLSGDATDVITISVWRDRESIDRFAHREADKPVFMVGGGEVVERWSLRHYDCVEGPEMDWAADAIS